MKTRALLTGIERKKRGKFQETQSLPDNLSVEHIMPDSWRTHWPMRNGLSPSDSDFIEALLQFAEDDSPAGQIAKRDRLKHTIGNLTLVTQSFNSRVSNEFFDTKRKEFEDQSVLMMTKDFVTKPDWDETEIETRGNAMASLACSIWPDAQ